ncbi:MAG: 50S ribosomal protein L11 methyltransferase, partial [Burkholderiales bacterium]|nr:50S ribosomal protein L11 methyltransferase [Burkholderiales bacterium]
MAYVSIRFDVDARAADAWSDALIERGALSVDVSDPAAGTPDERPLYAEPGVAVDGYWPVARIEALVAAGVDARALVAATAGD